MGSARGKFATCRKCEEAEKLQRKAANQPSPATGFIQRTAKAATGSSGTPSAAAVEAPQPAGLIVEVNKREISSGQMRQTEFLSVLRTVVRRH
jgi:hypothetical protein